MKPFDHKASLLLSAARAKSIRLALAESCTGGLVCAALTDIAGSSDVLDRGFVTYSNGAKIDLLGVDGSLIDEFGAVSEEVALAMAQGALQRSDSQITASITGIAGPGGGSAQKPVGLVYFAICAAGREAISLRRDYGDVGRVQVRELAVLEVMDLLTEAVESAA